MEEMKYLLLLSTNYNKKQKFSHPNCRATHERMSFITSSIKTRYILHRKGLAVQTSITGADYNNIWMRDYGQNTVYKNDVEDRLLVDWIYNRNRPYDDLVPST